jgi:hypothetical protein
LQRLLIAKSCSFAPVAQLDRASDYGSEGWGFEFLRAHSKAAPALSVMRGPFFELLSCACALLAVSGNSLFLEPARQRVSDLRLDLSRHLGHHRPTLSSAHEVPHRPHFGLPTFHVRGTGFIGDKVEFTLTKGKAALLVFVSTHGSWLVEGGRVQCV